VATPAVVFDGVSKAFVRGGRHDSLRDLIPAFAKRMFGADPATRSDRDRFWAVRDVSFTVNPGEALGIIGPNGAGKSTTLKLLTRILKPTIGRCHTHGRVGALIEVAAGFHPDLTGRENVFLQGAIMGMKRGEIAARFDEIVDFAEVHDFIDTPVKRYSSGMNARLGFSIAAHLNPDVLIIDEVLSVGDMAFQRRCVERMESFKRAGTAIVFVSHNLPAVIQLCDKALFLAGSVREYGDPRAVLRSYVDTSRAAFSVATAQDAVTIASSRLVDDRGDVVTTSVRPGTRLTLELSLLPGIDIENITFGFLIYRASDNLVVYDMNFEGDTLGVPRLTPDIPLHLQFSFLAHLTRADYYLEVHVCHNPTQRFLVRRAVGGFAVDEMQTWAGIANVFATARLVEDAVEVGL
jgi:lipopolysaccharide transport system ATP-binding protein